MRVPITIALLTLTLFVGCEKSERHEHEAQITTLAVSNVSAHAAIIGGEVTSEGLLPILSRGVCWSKEQNPGFNYYSTYLPAQNIAGPFSGIVDDFNAGDTYYVRAYYTTSKDTVYGNQVEFTTKDYVLYNPEINYGTVTDIDGNVYKTVTIGTQTWMAENLRATHYRNGDAVANVVDPARWLGAGSNEGAYCFYNYDKTKAEIYGAYYNWHAAADKRNIAPEGWHVATEEDWNKLKEHAQMTYGDSYIYELREATTAHWKNNYWFTFNRTGFTALGADRAYTVTDAFWYRGSYGLFWTKSGAADLPLYALMSDKINIAHDQPNKGFSIRCVKD